jgi:hypothetical protein
MTRSRLITAMILLGCHPAAGAMTVAEEVLAADAAFAARSVEAGQQVAFSETLADDAILFRPDPVPGREWLGSHEPATGNLNWVPAAAAASCSGASAVTTGRWQYTNAAGGEPVEGHYLTVWRRDGGGENDATWRVVLDHGIDHPSEAAPSEPLAAVVEGLWPASTAAPCTGEGSLPDLVKAEQALNRWIGRKGLPAALRRAAVQGALAYRDDSAPMRIEEDWPSVDAHFGRRSDARSAGHIVDGASDLAATYGTIVAPAGEAGAVRKVLYIRVWRRDGQQWRVAIDMETPLPLAPEP